MRYYLTVDCGGTKSEAVLFNETLQMCGFARKGSANANFLPVEEVRDNVLGAIREALGKHIPETVYLSFLNNKEEHVRMIAAQLPGSRIVPIGEGTMHLLAAQGLRDGIVALSGTGSGCIYIRDARDQIHAGGYGPFIGDEGSGFDMGSGVLKAAIRSFGGWGEETVLLPMIREAFGIPGELAAFSDFMGGIYEKPSPREHIADFCRFLPPALKRGDAVAARIVTRAGENMAAQILGLIHKYRLEPGILPVVASGGAWQVSPLMFETFCAAIRRQVPAADIRPAAYKTVLGGAALYGLERGFSREEIFGAFRAYDSHLRY